MKIQRQLKCSFTWGNTWEDVQVKLFFVVIYLHKCVEVYEYGNVWNLLLNVNND